MIRAQRPSPTLVVHVYVMLCYVSKSEQAKLRENEAKFIGGCQLPFNVVDNEHFRTLCQNLIEIGAKYGSVGARDVLVGRKSVRSDILKMATLVKNAIKGKLHKPVAEGTVAVTTDLWTDGVVQRSYLDMNFIWVETDDDSNWSLKTGMYACQLFEEKKTAINLRDCIDDILVEVGCEPDDITITTDKGANIVAATSQKQQLTCMCHRLNTAQKKAWDIVTSQFLVLWQFGFC